MNKQMEEKKRGGKRPACMWMRSCNLDFFYLLFAYGGLHLGGMLKSLYTVELSFMLRGTNVGPNLEAALPPYIGDALRKLLG